MKMLRITLLLVLLSTTVFSQAPVNDNCLTPTTLTSNAGFISGTLVQATTQFSEVTATTEHCGSSAFTMTVWYRFTATSTRMWVQAYLTSLSGNGGGYYPSRFTSVVYNTPNCLPLAADQVSCATMNTVGNGDGILTNVLTGLTIGNTYLVQIGYNNSAGSQTPIFNIALGDVFSPNCSVCINNCGSLCNWLFQPTVAQVIALCNSYPYTPYIEGTQTSTRCHTFLSNASSVNFSVVINSTCQSGNVSNFTWALYSSNCAGPIQTGTLANLVINGLTINETYTLCYTYTVPSNCYHTIHYPYVVGITPLPITLMEFNGIQINNVVKLTWKTAAEYNSSHFEIVRTFDNVLYEVIDVVPGVGFTTNTTSYMTYDTSPRLNMNYYYLYQYDVDGTLTKYGPVSVNFSSSETKEFYKITNVLGQEVDEMYRGLKIYYYISGEVKKVQ